MSEPKDANSGTPQDLLAQALNGADLVEYQPGSVVSRTILKQKTGNVTLFAFAAGEGLSEHTAPFDALVLILEGAALITVAGQEISAGTGDFVIMPANKPHALSARERFKMALVMIRS